MDKNINNTQAIFRTDNLSLASTLRYFNFKISNIARTLPNTRHVFFEFDESNKLKELVKDFWGETLSVEPQKFASVLKSTKSLLIQVLIDKIVLKGKTNEVEVMGHIPINHLNIGYELISRDSGITQRRKEHAF